MALVDETDSKRKTKTTKSSTTKSFRDAEKIAVATSGLGGLLGGLGSFIEKLGQLAEAGEELSRSGEFGDAGGKFRGVYGINVRTGIGDHGQAEVKVEPFGNVRRPAEGRPPGEDVREPLLDVYEEEDHVLVLVELPGVAAENIELKCVGGRLDLSAKRGKTTFRKQIDLPDGCNAERMKWECHNGVLKVRLER